MIMIRNKEIYLFNCYIVITFDAFELKLLYKNLLREKYCIIKKIDYYIYIYIKFLKLCSKIFNW